MPTSPPIRFLMTVSAYPPAKSAGMERGCQRLAEALARRGHRVTILTQRAEGLPEVREEAPGLLVRRQIKPLALGPLWGVTYMSQVRRTMKRLAGEWDFSLCHKLFLHSVSANAACRALGKPSGHLLVNAGDYSDLRVVREHKGGEWLLQRALDADAFFALSVQSREELLAEGVPPERIHTYRYFQDMDRFHPAGTPPKSPVLLYVGRFHAQKNLPLLIEAFEKIADEASGAVLRLVGKGPEEEAVRRRVEASPARGRIEVRGWVEDPAALYREAAAVVTASDAEGLSNVLVETLASGVPAVTTDVSGARDALDPQGACPRPIPAGEYFRGTGGLIVPIGDAGALGKAMKFALENAELRVQLARQARERALEAFSEEAVVPAFLASVERIMESLR